MATPNATHYLFVLNHATPQMANQAREAAVQLNIKVLVITNSAALVIQCTDEAAQKLAATGLFSFYTNKAVPASNKIVPAGIRNKWNTNRKQFLPVGETGKPAGRFTTLPLILTRPPQTVSTNTPNIKPSFLLVPGATPGTTVSIPSDINKPRKMDGKIAVQVVFVESGSDTTAQFSEKERQRLLAKLQMAQAAMANQHPSKNITWYCDNQLLVLSDVANKENTPAASIQVAELEYDSYWREPAVRALFQTIPENKRPISSYISEAQAFTLTGKMDDLGYYTKYWRDVKGADFAFVLFISAFSSYWCGTQFTQTGQFFADIRFVRIAQHADGRNDFGQWKGDEQFLFAHEMAHVFNAMDEYNGSEGTPCKGDGNSETVVAKNTPNGNCMAITNYPTNCCMRGEKTFDYCPYTRGQIGWSHLFLELYTGDVADAGTNDEVWLDIGDKSYLLDNKRNDRERGYRDGYAIWDETLTPADIKRVLIRKAKDGEKGGWLLDRVTLRYTFPQVSTTGTDGSVATIRPHSELICDEKNLGIWLQDNRTHYLGRVYKNSDFNSSKLPGDKTLINTLKVFVTTGTGAGAGTNDNVSFVMAGRTWILDNPEVDDFENGKTDVFILDPTEKLHFGDITSVGLTKSSDGEKGGWLLAGLRVEANNYVIYDNDKINFCLENENKLTWTDTNVMQPNLDEDAGKLITSLQVIMITADESKAGTNDRVTFTINDHTWNLDNPGHDDFERGKTDTFNLVPGGLILKKVMKMRISKSPDGDSGGWKLSGFQVIANNKLIYDRQGLNKWFQDNNRDLELTFMMPPGLL